MKTVSKLFNLLVVGLLVFSIVNGIYLALPLEIQEKIKWYNEVLALINAGWSAIAGLGGGYLLNYVSKAKEVSDEKYNLLVSAYQKLEKKVDIFTLEKARENNEVAELKKELKRNNKLIEAELLAKQTNPLIDEKVDEIIDKLFKGGNDEK